MSKQEEHNQKLKKFLKMEEENSLFPDDAFEKDAREGFSTFQNEEEILELKKSVDARINNLLNQQSEKEKSTKSNWIAAAVLVGIIGLSVYLVNDFFNTKEETIALNPTEGVQRPNTSPLANQPTLEEDRTNTKPGSTSASNETETNSVSSKKTILAESKKLNPEENLKSLKEVESLDKQDKSAEKNLSVTEAEDLNSQAAPVSFNESTTGKTAAVTNEKNRNSSKGEAPAAAQKETINQTSDDTEIQVVAAKSASRKVTGEAVKCRYEGGNKQLKKDLKGLLEEAKIMKPFDALLSINNSAQVIKVSFTNASDLNESEKKQVISVLKSLTKFTISGSLAEKETIEFRIEFRL